MRDANNKQILCRYFPAHFYDDSKNSNQAKRINWISLSSFLVQSRNELQFIKTRKILLLDTGKSVAEWRYSLLMAEGHVYEVSVWPWTVWRSAACLAWQIARQMIYLPIGTRFTCRQMSEWHWRKLQLFWWTNRVAIRTTLQKLVSADRWGYRSYKEKSNISCEAYRLTSSGIINVME
jgi:hypothetical protein